MNTQRIFLPPDFQIVDWSGLEPYYLKLQEVALPDVPSFLSWLAQVSELESVVSEALAWRYIRMTCDTSNKDYENDYLFFVENIQPHIAPHEDALNKKIASSPFLDTLRTDKAFDLYFKHIEEAVLLYREENIPLQTKLQTLAQEYSAISGSLSIEWEGKELTLQQASALLKETDRDTREKAYLKIQEARHEKSSALNALFSEMVRLRHQLAQNAGEANFRDYAFRSMGRFDYAAEDCFAFHNAIEKVVVPLKKELHRKRKEKLGLSELRPWDTSVDPDQLPKLTPFGDGKDLLAKSILCFDKLDPYFSYCLKTMEEMNHLDLESRKGKAPGGYNYPLAETGVPFIFMNAASMHRDLETMVHEGGHAIHSFLTKDLSLNAFKHTPSEVAELASMSMELLSMEAWDVFYPDPKDQKRAIREQLEGIIFTLPWIATIDAFQHWLYLHPQHTEAERTAKWNELSDRFDSKEIDYSGLEMYKNNAWHAQLHLFEVPFYYIEYGFAQLGALGVWKNYCTSPSVALEQYKTALKAGYTKGIPEIYQLAGVAFDFSENYIQSLFSFLSAYLQKLE